MTDCVEGLTHNVFAPQKVILRKELPHPKECYFPSPLELFWQTMTSQVESSKWSQYTPLYKNNFLRAETSQWRLLNEWSHKTIKAQFAFFPFSCLFYLFLFSCLFVILFFNLFSSFLFPSFCLLSCSFLFFLVFLVFFYFNLFSYFFFSKHRAQSKQKFLKINRKKLTSF